MDRNRQAIASLKDILSHVGLQVALQDPVVDSLEAGHHLAGLAPGLKIKVTGCNPVKDAGKLLEMVKEKVSEGQWVVPDTAITQLTELAEGCQKLLLAREKLAHVVRRVDLDLDLGFDLDVKAPLSPSKQSTAVMNALGLAHDGKPPRQFSEEVYQAFYTAWRHHREQMVQSRADLVSLRRFIQTTWLPWADQRLESRVMLGKSVLPE